MKEANRASIRVVALGGLDVN